MLNLIKKLLVATVLFPLIATAQTDSFHNNNWIATSNNYTKTLIDVDFKYSPEFGSEEGLAFYDTLTSVPTLANILAKRKEMESVVAKLKDAIPKEE
jgi:hypothetical protein